MPPTCTASITGRVSHPDRMGVIDPVTRPRIDKPDPATRAPKLPDLHWPDADFDAKIKAK